MHGESLAVITCVLLIHGRHIGSPKPWELLVVSLIVSVGRIELLLNSLLPGKMVSSVAHFISS